MSRIQRLFDLIQILRLHRRPIPGKLLAEELGISLRTLYRDIASLQAQGASIEGEPGLGYLLRPGFMLPPLMFSEEEIEALVLGSRWVERRADKKLRLAAKSVLAKISAILPDDLRHQLEYSSLLIGPSKNTLVDSDDNEVLIRLALRKQFKLHLTYIDLKSQESARIIWPIALGFFEDQHMLAAWCELRENFRHFRVDRILKLVNLESRYPEHRQALEKKWRKFQGLPERE